MRKSVQVQRHRPPHAAARPLIAAVLLLVAAVAMGCGGGSSDEGLTKQEFIARADAICAEANKQEAALKPGEIGWHYGEKFDDPAFLATFNAAGRDALRRLKALEPPDGDRASVAAVLSALQTLVSALGEQVADVRAGRRQTAANVTAYERGYGALAAAAGRYGFTECQGVSV